MSLSSKSLAVALAGCLLAAPVAYAQTGGNELPKDAKETGAMQKDGGAMMKKDGGTMMKKNSGAMMKKDGAKSGDKM